MKNFLLIFIAIIAFSVGVTAQNNLQLEINHRLGADDFAMNQTATNNMESNYYYSRLQYYISQITIIHDGGTETLMEDTWILVDAANATEVDLGDHNIEAVEGIKFSVGVEEAVNHNDPATWGNGHPLAPSFPSMHWGWTAGYRFIAIEGKGGANFGQTFQLHGLDDSNYFQTEIDLTAAPENGTISIVLDADYERALENIDVDGGVIVHGSNAEAKTAIENFRDHVFSASGVTSTVDFSEVNSFDIFPNPSTNGQANFLVKSTENLTYEVTVTDILGRNIQRFPAVQSNTTVAMNLENTGLYIVSLIKEGEAVITKKLMVN
jgi:hypothetical protein